jgi:hypothetical protein
MRYRIKIITYANGRKSYVAQKKSGPVWFSLFWDGSISLTLVHRDTRDEALRSIDKNHEGNVKSQTIEFEYINK